MLSQQSKHKVVANSRQQQFPWRRTEHVGSCVGEGTGHSLHAQELAPSLGTCNTVSEGEDVAAGVVPSTEEDATGVASLLCQCVQVVTQRQAEGLR